MTYNPETDFDFDRLSMTTDDTRSPTPTTTIADYPLRMDPTISDPYTAQGQRVGAILKVKMMPSTPDGVRDNQISKAYAVGDRMEIIQIGTRSDTCVLNLRSQTEMYISWNAFFPKKTGMVCSCYQGCCRCVIENPNTYYPYMLALEGKSKFHMSKEFQPGVADPATRAGQIPGAILVIKHKASGSQSNDCPVEVGDFIKFITGVPTEVPQFKPQLNNSNRIRAKNLRTQKEGTITWNSVFPVSTRAVCECVAYRWNCRCIYEDYDKSMEWLKSRSKKE